MISDLPPKLWLLAKPAIIRAASLDDTKRAMPLVGTFAAASVGALRKKTSAAAHVTAGLQLFLDANNAASYGGSGQTWTDLTAGGFNFYRGADNSATTDDPTFNSGPPAYFSTDGGDDFNTTAAHSGALPRLIGRQDQNFSIELWMYFVSGGSTNYYQFSNMNSGATGNGMALYVDNSDNFNLTSTTVNNTGGPTVSTSAWAQYGLSGCFNGSATCTWFKNGAAVGSTFTGNMTGWTTGDSANQLRLLSTNGSFKALSGTRIGLVRLYNSVLSGADFLQNYNANKATYGL